MPRRIVTLTRFVLLVLLLAEMGCGGSASSDPPSTPLSGNWQFNIYQNKSTTSQSESGFLQQNKNSVSGNLAVQATSTHNCSGVAPLSGTVSGSNVTLSINQFGSVLSLLGSYSTLGSTSSNLSSMTGTYTASSNVCGNPPTGSWTAVQVAPLTGTFSGTLTSTSTNSPLSGNSYQVSGELTQGPNTGTSDAELVGFMAVTNYPCLSTAQVRGLISGQNVTLSFFGPDGSLAAQLPQVTGNFATTASVAGKTELCAGNNSVCGAAQDNPSSGYVISDPASCQGVIFPVNGQESGTLTLTFP
jgi:hypothetical protein